MARVHSVSGERFQLPRPPPPPPRTRFVQHHALGRLLCLMRSSHCRLANVSQLTDYLLAARLPPTVLADARSYYRDQKQAPPKLEAEEEAQPAEERKPLDPEQLLREAEEQAGSLDDVRPALPKSATMHVRLVLLTVRAAIPCYCNQLRRYAG